MVKSVTISVDAMGGDNAPDVIIDGLAFFIKHEGQKHDLHVLLHGDEAVLAPMLAAKSALARVCEIRHTDTQIAMDMKPSQAVRRGKGTSLWNTVEAVKKGEAALALSAGNTGALMAISMLLLRRKEGVQRPALVAAWPTPEGQAVVLDVGANVDTDASQLTEFAVLGEAFYRAIYKKDRPTIGLLNVGTEDLKGNATIKAAHERLNESKLGLNYIGYVEGYDISMGGADVIVTDGFTGNIALKTAEGTAKLIGRFFSQALQGNIWSKFTTFLNIYALKKLKKRIDPRGVNGVVFLGLNGLVVKSHGGTDHVGFSNAVNVAVGLAESPFEKEIERKLSELHSEDDNIGFIA